MIITELMTRSDNFTDEQVSVSMAQSYIDEAIAIINTELNLHLPFVDLTSSYSALNDSWQIRLFLPYLNYGVKMNDTSLTEAQFYKNAFDYALEALRISVSTAVPEEYQGSDNGDGTYNTDGIGGAYVMDTSGAIPNPGWFANSDGGEW